MNTNSSSSEELVTNDCDSDGLSTEESYDQSESESVNISDGDLTNINDWEGMSLEPILKRKTKSPVWHHYGILRKNNKIFAPMSQKILCRSCFDAQKIKR